MMILLLSSWYGAPSSDISCTSYTYAAVAAAAAGWRKLTFKGPPSLPHRLHPPLTNILNKTARSTNSKMKRRKNQRSPVAPSRLSIPSRTSTPPRPSIPSKAPSPNSGASLIGERYLCYALCNSNLLSYYLVSDDDDNDDDHIS